MLSVFTDECGIIKAVSHGARRAKSRNGASTQFLSFAEFEFYESGGDVWTVKSIRPLDSFFPIQEDILKLSLCTYLADITYAVMERNNPDQEILRLLLNALYACAYLDIPRERIKAVYELRLMALAGYRPETGCCIRCGDNLRIDGFDPDHGGTVCTGCRHLGDRMLSPSAHQAMKYLLDCDGKRMFSFELDAEGMRLLGEAAEIYTSVQIEKNVPSLEYYRTLLKTMEPKDSIF